MNGGVESISPTGAINGVVRPSGDKSISHRAAMLLAISEGEAEIHNYSTGDDCHSTIECLRQIGADIKQEEGTTWIQGVGSKGFETPLSVLDCGNSGTTIRLMTGLLAGTGIGCQLTGDESLRSRPMGRIVDPLCDLGASIKTSDGYAPIEIESGSSVRGGKYKLEVASAQIKSAIMFSALSSTHSVEVVGSPGPQKMSASRDHSERMLRYLGLTFYEIFQNEGEHSRQILSIPAGGSLTSRDIDVPGDVSSAAFFLVAAAALPGSKIRIENVGLNPTRIGILRVLKRCGLDFKIENTRVVSNEPRGEILFHPSGKFSARDRIVLSGADTASVIDEIPVIAVLGTVLPHGIEIRDAGELRIKESDRISTVISNLKKMDANCEEFEDGLAVFPSRLKGAEIDSFGDHRIAMSFAVAGLFADGQTTVNGSDCVAISFPEFFEILRSLSV